MALIRHSDLDPANLAEGTVYIGLAIMGEPGAVPDRIVVVALDVTTEEGDQMAGLIDKYREKASGQQFVAQLQPVKADRHLRSVQPSRPPVKTTPAATAPARPGREQGTGRSERPQLIRAWCEKMGISVNERGRIPAEVEEQYDRAHALTRPASPVPPAPIGKAEPTNPAVPAAQFQGS